MCIRQQAPKSDIIIQKRDLGAHEDAASKNYAILKTANKQQNIHNEFAAF